MKRWQLLLCSTGLGSGVPFALMAGIVYAKLTFIYFPTSLVLLGSAVCLLGIGLSIKWYREFRWTTE